MEEPKKYATATAFRKALEERLKQWAYREGVDLQRLRRQVVFDRLRVCDKFVGGIDKPLFFR